MYRFLMAFKIILICCICIMYAHYVIKKSVHITHLFRFDQLKLHAPPGPDDARRVVRVVQQRDQELPQLQRAPPLGLLQRGVSRVPYAAAGVVTRIGHCRFNDSFTCIRKIILIMRCSVRINENHTNYIILHIMYDKYHLNLVNGMFTQYNMFIRLILYKYKYGLLSNLESL